MMRVMTVLLLLFATSVQVHQALRITPPPALLSVAAQLQLSEGICPTVLKANYWLRCREDYGLATSLNPQDLSYGLSGQLTLTNNYVQGLVHQYPENTNTMLKNIVYQNELSSIGSFLQTAQTNGTESTETSESSANSTETTESTSNSTETSENSTNSTETTESTANSTETSESTNTSSNATVNPISSNSTSTTNSTPTNGTNSSANATSNPRSVPQTYVPFTSSGSGSGSSQGESSEDSGPAPVIVWGSTNPSCTRLSELPDEDTYSSIFVLDWQYLQDVLDECLNMANSNNDIFNCVSAASNTANVTVGAFEPTVVNWRDFRTYQQGVNLDIIEKYLCIEEIDWPETDNSTSTSQ